MMRDVTHIAPRRLKTRREIIGEATGPQPLSIMLANLDYWYTETKRLEASSDPADKPLARIARHNSQRVAVECAQFVHPKLNSTNISGDEDTPLIVEHKHRLSVDALKGKSVQELGELYLAVVHGDDNRLADLCPKLIRQEDE